MPAMAEVVARCPAEPAPSLEVEGQLPFEDLYRDNFGFVWRNARRLGVPESQVDDAVQEVFIVLHRRRAELEQRGPVRAVLFRILVRVAADQRRAFRRKSPL